MVCHTVNKKVLGPAFKDIAAKYAADKTATEKLVTKVIKGGSGVPHSNKVGSISWDQVKAIAEDKMPDLNCFTLESAMSMVAGTARSMGVTVTGDKPF